MRFSRPLDLKLGFCEEIVNKAIHRFGCLMKNPMPSIFNKPQLSLIAEINARLCHLPPKSMVLRAP